MSRRRRHSRHRRLLSGLLAVGLGLGALIGCSVSSPEKKRLPDSTFTRVLTELHLLKARRINEMPVPRGLRDSIFARYEVRPSAFDSTLRYYSRRPEAFGTLYEAVIDTLNALQRPDKKRALPDSVQKRQSGDPASPGQRDKD